MRFLLDENIDLRLVAFLRSLGHDVTAIATDYQRSIADLDVLTLARTEQRIVITRDRDFGELVNREHQAHTGIVYFRLRTTRYAALEARMRALLQRYPDRLPPYVVVTDSRIRVPSRPAN